MIVGFTGSREGMTTPQSLMVIGILSATQISEVHHGDCKGADEQLDAIAKVRGIKRIVHPPISDYLRAFCDGEVILPQKDYLPRDEDIVDAAEAVIATPKEAAYNRRSGTWYTLNYAIRMKRRTLVILPDGGAKRYFIPEGEWL